MGRVVKAGLLGGLIVFIWGSISWMALPWHHTTIRSLPNGEAVLHVLGAQPMEHGVYVYPPMEPEEISPASAQPSQEALTAAWRSGPLVPFMVYYPAGIDPMAPWTFVRGAILALVTGVVVAYLLFLALPGLPTFGRRVGFVAIVAVIAALVGPIVELQWLMFPADYTLVAVADVLIAWTLAGVAMAWLYGRSERKDRAVAVPGASAGYQPPTTERSPR